MNSPKMKNSQSNHIEGCPTRERILQAAAKLFATAGYHQTSLRSLAQEAQVNLAAVNYHFRTKEGLLHGLIGQQVKLLQTNFLAMLEELEIGPEGPNASDILECLARAWLQEPRTSDEGNPRLLSILCCDPDQRNQKIYREHILPFYEQVFDLVRSTVPCLSEESARWRFNFLLGALSGTTWVHFDESNSESACSKFKKEPNFREMQEFLFRLFQ